MPLSQGSLHTRTRFRSFKSEKDSEALFDAVTANDVTTLKKLILEGHNPDMWYADEFNRTSKSILHMACGKGYTDCVRVLMEAGANPDAQDKYGQMPLDYAICCGFYETAHTLLKCAGDKAQDIVNKRTYPHNRCPLHYAAMGPITKVMEILIEFGANVSDIDCTGMTPLMYCLQHQDATQCLPAMKLLVEAGAEVNQTNVKNETVLREAAMLGNLSVVKYLLSVGADVNIRNTSGRNPLVSVLNFSFLPPSRGHPPVIPDVIEVIKVLTKAGSELNYPRKRVNPLMICMERDAEELFEYFLEQGADPNTFFVDSETTPIFEAIKAGADIFIRMLLKYNCRLKGVGFVDVGNSNVNGRVETERVAVSAYEVAAFYRNYDLMHLFLKAGDESWRNGVKALEKLQENTEESSVEPYLYRSIQDRLAHVPSLQELTALRARSCFGHNVSKAVPYLPVPTFIKNMILLTNLIS